MHTRAISRHTRRVQILVWRPAEDRLVSPRNICQDYFACFRLSSTGLTSDYNRLILLIRDQLLEGVLGNHEEVRARILNDLTRPRGSLPSHLGAIVTDFLRLLDRENRQTLVGIHADQDRGADLRENLALLLEAFLNVMED